MSKLKNIRLGKSNLRVFKKVKIHASIVTTYLSVEWFLIYLFKISLEVFFLYVSNRYILNR